MNAGIRNATVFKYVRPEAKAAKTVVQLCRSDLVYANVQVISHGGENNLHSHTALEGVWIVLKGKARFYGERDTMLAELGSLEGINIPPGFPYWFESVGDEILEILQVEAIDKTVKDSRRLDHTPQKAATLEMKTIKSSDA